MKKVCYLGDGRMSGPAAYLCGIMKHYDIAFDHVNGFDPPMATFCDEPYDLYILSDYARANFSDLQLHYLETSVIQGAGLLMFGGWESYYGRLGEYHNSILKEILPVYMKDADDRRNYSQPCVIVPSCAHPITDGLPWDTPPCVGGFNAFTPKEGAQVLMETHRFSIHYDKNGHDETGKFQFGPIETIPMLVVGRYGAGRTAAFATDVAPHWVGGFVDWGRERMFQLLSDDPEDFIDVGADYARFFKQLIDWTRRQN